MLAPLGDSSSLCEAMSFENTILTKKKTEKKITIIYYKIAIFFYYSQNESVEVRRLNCVEDIIYEVARIHKIAIVRGI